MACLLLSSGCPGGHVPQTARRARTVYVLQEASTALGSFREKTGQYPSSQQQVSPLGPIIADLDSRFHDRDEQIDGWGSRLFFWSNGQILLVISSGRDRELDLDYGAALSSSHASPADRLCGDLRVNHKDDIALIDGKPCLDYVIPRGGETQK